MKRTIEELWRIREAVTIPATLKEAVLRRIHKEERRIARTRLAFFGVLATASFGSLFPVFQYSAQAVARSGFSDIISLVFSDANMLSVYWKEFLFSLAESLPILWLIVLLVVSAVLLWSLAKASEQVQTLLVSA